jgi:hypothetical protein
MKKNFARSLEWIRRLQPGSMKTGYETIKRFELSTAEGTRVVTSISAKSTGDRVYFRVATLREHDAFDGTVRRSPWLGVRELVLKAELEKQAMDFIAQEVARRKLPIMTFSV